MSKFNPDPEFMSATENAIASQDSALFVKNQFKHLEGRNPFMFTSSANVIKRIKVLQELHKQHDELEVKFFEEMEALESKYQKLYDPLYAKRYEIINGVVEVESNTKKAAQEAAGDEKDKADEEKGVPNFWLTAMKNNGELEDEIQERDEAALKYLKDIKCYKIHNPKGFKLEFHFDCNPYFSNSVLEKTYHMVGDKKLRLEKAIGTEIQWYTGKNLTAKFLQQMTEGGLENIAKVEIYEGFFDLFDPLQIADDMVHYLDQETFEEIQDQVEDDFDVGTTIKDEIIPHAVLWFTGEAVQEQDIQDNVEEGDNEGGEDDEDGDYKVDEEENDDAGQEETT